MAASSWVNLKLIMSYQYSSVVDQTLASFGAFTSPGANPVVELVDRQFPLVQTLIPILEQGCRELET